MRTTATEIEGRIPMIDGSCSSLPLNVPRAMDSKAESLSFP